VLTQLREHKLYLKPEKCQFDALEMEYLGMIILEGNVQMDPVKVEGIIAWPAPRSKHDVQLFLGFCNFYRRFIRNFADIARPLHVLTSNVPFVWTADCQTSFDKLKESMTFAPVLTIPNDDGPFRLE